jgi:hypothetical protein
MKVVSRGLREFEKWRISSSEDLIPAFSHKGKAMLDLVSLAGQLPAPVEVVS